jgi:hydrogenase maturation factor HypE
MEFILNESQYKRIFESNTVIDNINNLINSDVHEIKIDFVSIILDKIIISGDVDSIDYVVAKISKIYYRGQDVTEFSFHYIFSDYNENEGDLSYDLKNKIANILNRKYLKYINTEVSDYQISFDF